MRRVAHSLLLLALLAAPVRADEILVDGIAAQVGTDIVLYSEVMQMVAHNEHQLRQAGASESDIAKLRADGLEALIESRLIEKVARDADLQATDAELDATVEAIAQENGLSVAQLQQSVLSQGMRYEDYRKEIKTQLERQKVVNAMVGSRVRIEEGEVEALYEERYADQPQGGTTVHLRQILVPVGEGPDATREQVCAFLGKMRDAIEQGTPFAEVAAQYSVAAPGSGGDIGWLHMKSMASWMVALVESLEPGQVSQVQALPIGCTMVQLVERKTWTPVSLEEAKPALQSEVFNRKLTDAYREWMEELRSKTFIERRGYFADAARFRDQSGAGAGPTSEFESGLEGYDVLRGAPEQEPAQ